MRAKLIYVTVCPLIVIEDENGNVVQILEESHKIPAEEWHSYSGDRFQNELKELQEQLL